MPHEYAVFAEHSFSQKPMTPGANIRVFNKTEAGSGMSIRREESGTVVLLPGLYHITGHSLVAYYDPKALDQTQIPISVRPYGGYCRLMHEKDAESRDNNLALQVGTGSDANLLPSLIDTYYEVKPEDREARLILQHQVGENVEGIYLQVSSPESTWRIFARLAIYRIA